MMSIILCSIIVLSMVVILVFFFSSSRRYSDSHVTFRFTSLLLPVWLVAAAVWDRFFFQIQIPGFFDITIQRLLFIIVMFTLVTGLYTGRVYLRKNMTLELFMFLFIAVCLVSMAQHGFLPALPHFKSPWYQFITGYLFPFIVFLFAKHYLTRGEDILLVFYALFFLGSYLAIISFFEFFNLPQLVFPRYITDPEILLHMGRARGPFLNSAFNGVALTIGFVCGVHLLKIKQGFTKALFLVLLSLFFPAAFFTQTRSVYLCLLITLVLLFAFYRTTFPKWKLFSLPLALFLIFMVAISPRLTSEERRTGGVYQVSEVESRMALAKASMRMFLKHPFFGVGFAQFVPAFREEYYTKAPVQKDLEVQHNHILGMLAETGLVGSLIYLGIVAVIFRRLYQLAGKIPRTGFMGTNLLLVILIVWAVYLNNNLFAEPSFCLFINVVPFTFAGLADGLYNKYVLGTDEVNNRPQRGRLYFTARSRK